MLRNVAFCFLILLAIVVASVGTMIAYFVSVLITGLIAINVFVSAIAFGSICFGLLWMFASWLALGHPKRYATAMSLISAFVIAAVVALPTLLELFTPPPNNATDRVINALQEHTIALETVQAGSGFEDLRSLEPILEGKRIVALGEATHGTREFFQRYSLILNIPGRLAFSLPSIVCGIIGSTGFYSDYIVLLQKKQHVCIYLLFCT